MFEFCTLQFRSRNAESRLWFDAISQKENQINFFLTCHVFAIMGLSSAQSNLYFFKFARACWLNIWIKSVCPTRKDSRFLDSCDDTDLNSEEFGWEMFIL